MGRKREQRNTRVAAHSSPGRAAGVGNFTVDIPRTSSWSARDCGQQKAVGPRGVGVGMVPYDPAFTRAFHDLATPCSICIAYARGHPQHVLMECRACEQQGGGAEGRWSVHGAARSSIHTRVPYTGGTMSPHVWRMRRNWGFDARRGGLREGCGAGHWHDDARGSVQGVW